MSYLLVHLSNKDEVDYVLSHTIDKLVVLRFGQQTEHNTMIVDDMVCAAHHIECLQCPHSTYLTIANLCAASLYCVLCMMVVVVVVGIDEREVGTHGSILRCGYCTSSNLHQVL
jgi:hypothetical protein